MQNLSTRITYTLGTHTIFLLDAINGKRRFVLQGLTHVCWNIPILYNKGYLYESGSTAQTLAQ